MNEDRTATVGNAGPRIVIKLDDQVVEMILAPKPVRAALWVKPHRAIIVAVARVLRPAILLADAAQRQPRTRTRQAVCPPPEPNQPEAAARGPAVALALVCSDAAPAQRHRKNAMSGKEMPAGWAASRRRYPNQAEPRSFHRISPRNFRSYTKACNVKPLLGKGRFVTPANEEKNGTDRLMANARTIVVVDDDAELRETLIEQLALHQEFSTESLDNAQAAIERAKQGHIDLLIMDVGLPDMDGREAVRVMRKNGFKSPVIMLTGHDTDSDTVLGLEAGANDYVTKPFKFAVLLARIRAQLRSHEASEDAIFPVGHYSFRPGAKLLVDDKGKKTRLTEKETAILRYLYRAGKSSVPRDQLLTEVWGYNSGVTTHTLETHIYRLRQKIEKDPSNATLLVTEGGGYKLVP